MNGFGTRDEGCVELLEFGKLELMTLPLSAGSQEFSSKQCIGFQQSIGLHTVQSTSKNVLICQLARFTVVD
jgi:hypothetical protein